MNLDYLVVGVASALAIALHVALFVLFRRWMDRDLALSFAGGDPRKRAWMLARLGRARRERVRRRDLPAWLERQAAGYGGEAGGRPAQDSE
ncbi:hypothetical protein [Pseudoxanthomonas sp. 10H]|uniref:hypothetical protein n=1 Tax=Pseudoxanthomonas sp. 10H TaxID=3242729 RepID=UPI0035585F7B